MVKEDSFLPRHFGHDLFAPQKFVNLSGLLHAINLVHDLQLFNVDFELDVKIVIDFSTT